jgi:hypothetical protein
MSKIIDLTGKRFGRLKVISRQVNSSNPVKWLCLCDCGNSHIVDGAKLRSNESRSCGCLKIELQTTHGKSETKEYYIWCAMIQRCENKNNKRYKDYGGRGISVCERWRNSFSNFYSDMGAKPNGMTLERVNNSKGYSPKNCCWATRETQQRNMRKPKTNTSGFMGVRKRGHRYTSRIRANGKSVHLGTFNTIEEAIEARLNAEKTYWKKERKNERN